MPLLPLALACLLAAEEPPAPPPAPPATAAPAPAPAQDADPVETLRASLAALRRLGEEMEPLAARAQVLAGEEFRAATAARDQAKLDAIKEEHGRLMEKRKRIQETAVRTLKEALALADAAFAKAPDRAEVVDARADLRLMSGDVDGGYEDSRRTVALKPGEARTELRLAGLAAGRNGFEEALRLCDAVLAREKENLQARYVRGAVLVSLGRFDEAVAALEPLAKSVDRTSPFPAAAARQLEGVGGILGPWKREQEIRAAEAKADDLPRVRFTTSGGVVVLELFENEAPATVGNFVGLVEARFYDGTKFHRVIPNFMAQGGDPNSRDADPGNDGQGGPGYAFPDEIPAGKSRLHFRGTLSMANSGPDSNGSQFFLTVVPTTWLDGKHTVFGRVVSGQEVVDALKPGDLLVRAEVLRKRAHEYRPAGKVEAPPAAPPK